MCVPSRIVKSQIAIVLSPSSSTVREITHIQAPYYYMLLHRRRGLQWTEDNGRFVRATRVLLVLAHAASPSSVCNGSVLLSLLLLSLLLLYYNIIFIIVRVYERRRTLRAECLIDVRGQR